MVSTRAIKQIELETIDKNIDFAGISSILKERKNNRVGNPFLYSNEQLLRIIYLQDRLQIQYDTEMERELKRSSDYRKFCRLRAVPSHDTITRFKHANIRHLKNLFTRMDKILEELGYFKDDDLSGDGVDISLGKRSEIASWGARSDKEKFFGLWLLTANSTNRELVREFEIGTGKIGQVNIGYELLDNVEQRRFENPRDFSMDGIFDNKVIMGKMSAMGFTPVIPYNPRKSKIKYAEDLPDTNWRLSYIPFLKDKLEFKERFKKRTGSERENSRIKLLTLIGRLKEKTTIAWKTSGVYVISQMMISLISMQVSALAQWLDSLRNPLPKQLTLADIVQM